MTSCVAVRIYYLWARARRARATLDVCRNRASKSIMRASLDLRARPGRVQIKTWRVHTPRRPRDVGRDGARSRDDRVRIPPSLPRDDESSGAGRALVGARDGVEKTRLEQLRRKGAPFSRSGRPTEHDATLTAHLLSPFFARAARRVAFSCRDTRNVSLSLSLSFSLLVRPGPARPGPAQPGPARPGRERAFNESRLFRLSVGADARVARRELSLRGSDGRVRVRAHLRFETRESLQHRVLV